MAFLRISKSTVSILLSLFTFDSVQQSERRQEMVSRIACKKGLVFVLAAMTILFCPAWSRSTDCPVCPDSYETDDAFWQAKHIAPFKDSLPQRHNFHDEGDQDWVVFDGFGGEWYTIETSDLGNATDTVLELYDTDGITPLLDPIDDGWIPPGERISWQCPKTGNYFLKVRQYDPKVFGADTDYDLRVYIPTMLDDTGTKKLRFFDKITRKALEGVCLQESHPLFRSRCSDQNGEAIIAAKKRNDAYPDVTIKRLGYKDILKSFTIKKDKNPEATISMEPY
jgi:hypothetical protein